MRREGRQHGLVLAIDPAAAGSPHRRRRGLLVDASDSPPTTAFRTRVPARPTNHSKYTGGGGARHQSSKSRDKSKGARKARALDVALNPRLASWRVAGGGGCGLAGGGGSASAAAVYLWGFPLEEERWLDKDLEEEEMEEVGRGKMVTNGEEEGREGLEREEEEMEEMEEGKIVTERVEEKEGGGEMEEEGVDDGGSDEDDMDFFEVWAVWDYVDEEDWCVVGEMEV